MAMKDYSTKKDFILEIKLFGTFDILYGKQSLFNKGKNSNKIFEILKYLIINNGKELSPEIICENIWPDTEYMDVRNTITTYIFRLNKFLKEGNSIKKDLSELLKIVCQKGSYKLTISNDCNLDIREFSLLYERIEEEENIDNKIFLIKQAIDLYTGELLKDSTFDGWVTPYRNYYRRIFSEIHRTILSIYMEQKEYKEILRICKNMFDIYALDEYSNLYYLKALYQLNYINEAIAHYDYVQSRFVSELGIQPSDEMKELYFRMKNSRGFSSDDVGENIINYTQLFSEDSEFWKIFSNAIEDYMEQKAETKSYSIGYAEIESENEEDFKSALEAFIKAVQTVLRKEDCYSFFEPNIVIFVLNDVPEVFYSLIKERIEKIFKENYTKDIKLDISVSSCFTHALGQN